MAGIKETVKVNVQGALLGVEEGGFSFVTQFKNMPRWKQWVILIVAIAIIPAYLIARIGTEQYLTQKYGRESLAVHPAFKTTQQPVVGAMTIIRNPNGTYSAVVQVTNPNIELSATNISYTASFLNSNKQLAYNPSGTMYLLPDEKKYLVFPRIESASAIVSGTLKLEEVKWQKRLSIPEVKLRASEPILTDESNPLTFVVEGSIINESPYQVGTARIVFLLYDKDEKIIGVSQRDENTLVPLGRRAYKQLWPGLYKSQVKKVQVVPTTNSLDPQNITTDKQPTNSEPPTDNPFDDDFNF